MANCYRCDILLTPSNSSEEHIIINALGGRLKSSDLLCTSCNSRIGSGPDAALASQLNVFANLINVKRQRGVPQKIAGTLTDTGEEVLIGPGGKPEFRKPKIVTSREGDKEKIQISAPNIQTAQSILKGLKKKYGSKLPDIESLLSELVTTETKLEAPVKIPMQIAGNDLLRSVTKAGIGFYVLSGGDRQVISHLIPYIDGDMVDDFAWLFYPERAVFSSASSQIVHAIVVEADPAKKIAFCIVEYFSTAKYLVVLDKNYNGEKISATYAYDLLELKEVEVDPTIDFEKEYLLSMVRNMPRPYEAIKESMDRFMTIAMNKQWSEYTTEEILRDIWPKTFGKYPEGTEMTDDMKSEFVREFVNALTPYIESAANKRKERGDGHNMDYDPEETGK